MSIFLILWVDVTPRALKNPKVEGGEGGLGGKDSRDETVIRCVQARRAQNNLTLTQPQGKSVCVCVLGKTTELIKMTFLPRKWTIVLKMNSKSSTFSEHLNFELKFVPATHNSKISQPQGSWIPGFCHGSSLGRRLDVNPGATQVQKPGDLSPTFNVTFPRRPSLTTGFKREAPHHRGIRDSSLSSSKILSIN